jgi:hypothetical protein
MHHFAVKYLTQYGKGDTMTKIAMFILLTFCVPAYATTMCALEDTTAVILDPSVNGTGYKYDVNTFTWNTTFPYGTIYGVAACLSVGGGSPQGTINYDLDAGGGEKEGGYCWCKMTHPASSRWVFYHSGTSASGCASVCTDYCGRHAISSVALRSGLFGSVGK